MELPRLPDLPKPGWQHLVPESFRGVARHLHEHAPAVAQRARERAAQMDAVARVAAMLPVYWGAANGEEVRFSAAEMAEALRSLARAVTGIEQSGAGATASGNGLVEMGTKASQVAQVLDDENRLVQEWNQQLVGFGSEVLDRATTFVFQHERTGELEEYYHQRWLEREAATARHDAALRQWRELCGNVADVLRRTTEAMDAAVVDVPPALHPVAARHPSTAQSYLRRMWADRSVVPFLERTHTDPDAMRRWWSSLDERERNVLINVRPDLIDRYLGPYLSPAERKRFEKTNAFAMRSVEYQFDLKFHVPIKTPDDPIGTSIAVATTAVVRKTVNSDGTVDVRFEVKVATTVAGATLHTKTEGGGEVKYSLTLRFATEAEYEAAKDKIAKAREDDGLLSALYKDGNARHAIEELFGHNVGWEMSGGVVGSFEASFGSGSAKFAGSLGAGYYDDNVKHEHGMYLRGTASVSVSADRGRASGSASGEISVDGRLAFSDDGRRYLSLNLGATTTASATGTLTSLGLTPDTIAKLKLSETASGGVSVGVKIEITDANRDKALALVQHLASGRLTTEGVGDLADDLDIVVLVNGTAAEKAGASTAAAPTTTLPGLPPPPARPPAPSHELGMMRKDSATVAAWRKVPDSNELYRLDD